MFCFVALSLDPSSSLNSDSEVGISTAADVDHISKFFASSYSQDQETEEHNLSDLLRKRTFHDCRELLNCDECHRELVKPVENDPVVSSGQNAENDQSPPSLNCATSVGLQSVSSSANNPVFIKTSVSDHQLRICGKAYDVN